MEAGNQPCLWMCQWVVSRDVMSWRFHMSGQVLSCPVVSCRAVPCHVVVCRVMLCHVMLCHVPSCYEIQAFPVSQMNRARMIQFSINRAWDHRAMKRARAIRQRHASKPEGTPLGSFFFFFFFLFFFFFFFFFFFSPASSSCDLLTAYRPEGPPDIPWDKKTPGNRNR